MSTICPKHRSGIVRRPPWGRSHARAPLAKRLVGLEPLESRCLLSAAAHTAATLDTFFGGYLSVSGIYRRLDEMAATYPTITEVVDYGDSYSKTVGGVVTPAGRTLMGYDLLAMKISNEAIPGPKPAFVLMAGIHAREIATPEIAVRFADWLTQNYGQDADATWLVDEHEIWIMPTTNPDGHWYVELGAQTPNGDEPWLWRKNGHAYEPGAWPPTAFDHYGVDLNRNFDFHWGTQGVEWDGRSQTYPGPEAASEPETLALQELLGSVFSDQRGPQDSDSASDTTSGIFVSLHQLGELVLWPWWDTESAAPNGAGLEAIGRKLASYNGYTAGSGASALYHASGTADDWTYGTLGVPSFTFEIGREFTPSYAAVDGTLWPANIGALIYAAKLARTPYATVLGPDANRVTVERVGAGFTVSATIDDTASGDQEVAAAEYYADTPPWHSGAVSHSLAAVDGSFGGQVEQVAASLSMDGLGPGRHMVYVRGRDADGHWGPFSAGRLETSAWQNTNNPFDVDGVDDAQALDAMVLINSINLHGTRLLPAPASGSGNPPPFLDVTGDGWLSAEDVLRVINHVNAKSALAVVRGESEMATAPTGRPAAAAVDLLMATWPAAAQQRAGMDSTVSWAKVRRPSDEGPDSISALAGEGMEWNLQ